MNVLDTLFSGKMPLVMGIVNATGDSFSEGSSSAAATAVDRGLALLDDGADILDIGGESTRPGAVAVPEKEECQRVTPVIRELKRLRPECVISIDTRKSVVAEAALDAGADILNDVSMLRYDSKMTGVAAQSQAPLVLAHSRGTPENMRQLCDYNGDVVGGVLAELLAARDKAVSAGVKHIVLDPNFGFAKTAEQDWELLRNIRRFCDEGTVLAGISRKSFLGKLTGEEMPEKRLGSTIAAALYLAGQGVHILRVHDVRQLRDALKVYQYLGGAE